MESVDLMKAAYTYIARNEGSTVPEIQRKFGVPKSTAYLWLKKGAKRGLLSVHVQERTVQNSPGHLPHIYKITSAGLEALERADP